MFTSWFQSQVKAWFPKKKLGNGDAKFIFEGNGDCYVIFAKVDAIELNFLHRDCFYLAML